MLICRMFRNVRLQGVIPAGLTGSPVCLIGKHRIASQSCDTVRATSAADAGSALACTEYLFFYQCTVLCQYATTGLEVHSNIEDRLNVLTWF